MDGETQADLFDQVLHSVEGLIRVELDYLANEPDVGTVLAQPKIVNGGDIVRQHLSAAEHLEAFRHIEKIVYEAALPINRQTFDQLVTLALSVGFDDPDSDEWQFDPAPPSGAWSMNSWSHPELLNAIEPHRRRRDRRAEIYCGFGWAEIVMDCHASIHELYPDYRITAIKQKWAELQFIAGSGELFGSPSQLQVGEITKIARARSVETCEWCGDPGSLRDLALYWTLCDPCTDAMHESDGRRGRELDDAVGT